jgi:hypothetical protein
VIDDAVLMQLDEDSPKDFPLRLKHKFGESIESRARLHISGTESQKIVAVNVKLSDAAKAGIFTLTATGKVNLQIFYVHNLFLLLYLHEFLGK